MHNNRPVAESRYRNVPMPNGSVVLHLCNVAPADGGLYTAIIKDNHGHCSTECEVVVDCSNSDNGGTYLP